MEIVLSGTSDTDRRRRIRFRDTAVDMLRRTPTFAHTSRRLLSDLMDVAEHQAIDRGPAAEMISPSGVALLVVLDGAVDVLSPAQAPPATPGGLSPGSSHGIIAGPAPLVPLPRFGVGVHLGEHQDPPWAQSPHARVIKATGDEEAYFIVLTRGEAARWLRASPTLRHSIAGPKGYRALVTDEEIFQ